MKNKKLLSFVLTAAVVSTVGIAAGCNPEEKGEKIEAPVLTLTGNTITWSAVEHAEGYDVYEGANVVSEAQTACSYTINQTNPGTYEYTVVATTTEKGYRASDKSTAVTYTVPEGDTSTKLTGKIYVVGDSTVCGFSDNYYLPRYGYGTQLQKYINCDVNQIYNLALSGRSSKSFISETNYTTLKNSITTGDYLIIGFGHNDEKSDDSARYTSPNGNKETAGSFQKSLYDNYVKMAQDKGATPILCTPIVRYDDKGSYTGSKIHVTSEGDYAAAIKALGADTNTTVVDLTELTKAEYKKNNAEAAKYHAHTTYKLNGETKIPDGRDDTHINEYGAKMVAYKFAQAILSSDCSLKISVKTDATAPTAADYEAAINSKYVKPDYNAFNPANTTAKKLTDDWYGTAMGSLGGDSVSPFEISYSGGKYTVGNASGDKGKITSGVDGFAAAFIQVDVSKNFTASATITIKSSAVSKNPNQAGFGMMLRDDILINKRDDSLASNYVTAGVLGDGSSALFSRENGALKTTSNSTTVAVGKTYTVSIERIGQTVNVVFNDGAHIYTKTHTDFDFVAVDNGYMYLCLFATRSIVAEFTDVQFEITGESQGA